MVGKDSKKKISKRKPKSRKRAFKKRTTMSSINKVMGNTYIGADPFKPVKSYRVKYAGVHTLSVGASGTLGTIQDYNLNSCHDPDSTGTGHKVYGWDILKLAYNRYKVNGCKVTIKLTDPTIDAMNVTWMITNPSNATDTIAASSPYTCQERQMCGSLSINNSGSQKATRSFYVPLWLAAGVTKLQYKTDIDNYTAPTNDSPANKIQFQIACADLRGGSSGTIIYEIELIYYVTLYQRKVVPQA